MKCTIEAYSRQGPDRNKNEDACGFADIVLYGKKENTGISSFDETDFPVLTILADGLGGHLGGDIASHMAIEFILGSFRNSPTQFQIEKVIVEAHEKIEDVSQNPSHRSAMGTTLVGALIDSQKIIFFNVGDSRAYTIQNNNISQVSHDDVYPGERTGVISQCLGGGGLKAPKPHIFEREISVGDGFILVSDGITDVIANEIILDLFLRNENDCAKKLCEKATELGGGDDATALICTF